MYSFTTTGTTDFLKQVAEKYPHKTFYFMRNGGTTLVYYEDTNPKSIFVSGKSYQIQYGDSELVDKGFVVLDFIPITDEEGSYFEEKAKKQLNELAKDPGVTAVKLLSEKGNNTFVILTQWKTEEHHARWKKMSTKQELNFAKSAKLPAYFLERPFTHHYYMLNNEADEQ
ncbi:MAG TPA: antibiotic biosynthesis monooxygenase family protein [Pseudogracilibacillus sp.]|nr:antibiotic biosynthesis monooxygenase family protein [Pseudogracilibacillus sp.]